MYFRFKVQGILVIALAIVGVSPAGAQTEQKMSDSSGNIQISVERQQQLSPQEQIVESEKVVERIKQVAEGMRGQLEQARAERDVVKTLCLNDKLSQIDVAIRSAKERQLALQSAVDRHDTEMSEHEFTILNVLRQRADQLVGEADQCIGEGGVGAQSGETRVVTSVDPTIAGEENASLPQIDSPTVSTGGGGGSSTDSSGSSGAVVVPPQCISCPK